MSIYFFLMSFMVGALGSPCWKDRERAERQLRTLGLFAYPALMSAQCHQDPEIAYRSCNLLSRLEHHVDDIAAMMFVFRAGSNWVYPCECCWFCHGNRRLALDRLAKRMNAYPEHGQSCWQCGYLAPLQEVAAVGNYLRSRAIGKPLSWSTPWHQCVYPDFPSN